MGLKEWLFNPYEEPQHDPHDLNDHGVNPLVFLTIIPLAGMMVVIASLAYAATDPQNEYNMANTAWNTAVVGTGVQILWLLFFAVIAVA